MKITRYENAIFGLRPIIEAITAGQEIDTLFIQKGLKGDIFPELWELVKKHRVNYKHVPVEKLNRLTRKNHQGVFAFVSPITFHRTENVIPQLFEEGKVPLFLILDRVTDVRNFGAIVRTAECSGIDCIIIQSSGSAPVNGDTIKTSSGAIFNVPICKVSHIKDAIFLLKQHEIKIYGASEKSETDLYQTNFGKKQAIIMGSEGKGLSNSVIKLCDSLIKIPLLGKIESLNVSVACGAILYELVRQKNY